MFIIFLKNTIKEFKLSSVIFLLKSEIFLMAKKFPFKRCKPNIIFFRKKNNKYIN